MVCSKSGHFDIFVTWWACVSLLLCCFNVSGFVSTLIVKYIWWFEIPGVQSALQHWQYHFDIFVTWWLCVSLLLCSSINIAKIDLKQTNCNIDWQRPSIDIVTILWKSIPYTGLLNIEFADFCQTIISNYFLYISNE